MPAIPPLSAQGLHIARADHTVVEAVSLALGAGEWLHLQGRNGAGKTTLLEALCGLRPLAGGRLEGCPPVHALHWLGHRNALAGALSARENLTFWCRLQAAGAAGVGPALERVGLGRASEVPVRTLSTGQRRRAALARLLALVRPWWFLDEPLAGLDDSGSVLVAELLAAHLAGGGAAVVTSHQGFAAIAGLPPPRVLRL